MSSKIWIVNEGVGRRRSRRVREDGKTEAEKRGGQDGDSGRDCLGQTECRCSVTGYREGRDHLRQQEQSQTCDKCRRPSWSEQSVPLTRGGAGGCMMEHRGRESFGTVLYLRKPGITLIIFCRALLPLKQRLLHSCSLFIVATEQARCKFCKIYLWSAVQW